MPLVQQSHFVYDQSVVAHGNSSVSVSQIGAAIGEPARSRMLYCLLDGRARTGTELAVVADVTPSTASVHLQRLVATHLVKVLAQGKHRYYSLQGEDVAAALEALIVLAGGSRVPFTPSTPSRLRLARTCYDHIAGTLGVHLHDRFTLLGWLKGPADDGGCDLTPAGAQALKDLGVPLEDVRTSRRRFAYACLDWSERRPHLAGALGAALLEHLLRKKWVQRDLDSRALSVTALGRRELHSRFGLHI